MPRDTNSLSQNNEAVSTTPGDLDFGKSFRKGSKNLSKNSDAFPAMPRESDGAKSFASGNERAPRVLVTDAGRGSALAMIRSLGRQGWHVVAADASQVCPGMVSRYARGKLRYPAPESNPGDFVDTLQAEARRQQIDLIIPVTDSTILPLSAARDRFHGLCQLALPTMSSLEVVTDKFKTIQLARDLGVPTPRTHLVRTVEEALDCCTDLGWPVVLKPQRSKCRRDDGATESFVVGYAQDKPSLIRQMKELEGRCPVLLQEYSCGTGIGVELLVYQGRPLAAFQHRRLREYPAHGGPSSLRESVSLDPKLYDWARRLLQEVQWTGLAMVEFKVGESGAALMEINGRAWGSLPLAVHCGMDFPARLAELWLCGVPVADKLPDASYRIGVRGHNLELEVKWIVSALLGRHRFPFLEVPRRRQAWAAMAELFHPAYRFDFWTWNDPKPGLLQLFRVFRKFRAPTAGPTHKPGVDNQRRSTEAVRLTKVTPTAE